jgi:transposase InsO family protein
VIRDHLTPEFTVTDCCRVLRVSVSGYYRWRQQPVGKRETRRRELTEQIRLVHEASRRVYGSPRVYRELSKHGVTACRNTVAKVMRDEKIVSRMRRKWRAKTTDSKHAYPVAPNLIERDFRAAGPNLLWLGDITYIPTLEGFLYLATVLDLFSRRIVGWSMADHLRAELPLAALRMAVAQRRPAPGLIHHSDRGVQYACVEYRRTLEEHGMHASMSHKGDCYDNAPQESFFGKFKTEWVPEKPYATREEARASAFEYIEAFYNRKRLHSSLGYVSPEAFEASHGL